MKKINLRESLLELDKQTSFKYTLTDLYEACMLGESDKKKLVQYVADRDIKGMSNMLSNAAGAMTENVADDLADDEVMESLPGIGLPNLPNPLSEECDDTTLSLQAISKLEDIEYIMSYEMADFVVYDGDKCGEYRVGYDSGYTLDIRFDLNAPGYVYYINGEGPYETMSDETIKSDIKRELNSVLWGSYVNNKKKTSEEPLQEYWHSDEDEENSEYEYIARKYVQDSNGFQTEYTWYKSPDGLNVFVFGDSDLYTPEDGNFDHEEENDDAAQEWFDSYVGFGDDFVDFDDLDEGIGAVLGDLAGRAVKDTWQGVKNFGKGLKDTAKDIKTTVKTSDTVAKVKDGARALKGAKNVDDLKQNYYTRQQKRKDNRANKPGVTKDTGDPQDWKFVVNGRRMKYDDFMKIPENKRNDFLKKNQIRVFDVLGKEQEYNPELVERFLLESDDGQVFYEFRDARGYTVHELDDIEVTDDSQAIMAGKSNPKVITVTKFINGSRKPDEVLWERESDRWYLSRYVGGSEYEYAEGGYYYETLTLDDSLEFATKEEAMEELKNQVKEYDEGELVFMNDTEARFKFGKYIGDVEELHVERERGLHSSGKQVYESLSESHDASQEPQMKWCVEIEGDFPAGYTFDTREQAEQWFSNYVKKYNNEHADDDEEYTEDDFEVYIYQDIETVNKDELIKYLADYFEDTYRYEYTYYKRFVSDITNLLFDTYSLPSYSRDNVEYDAYEWAYRMCDILEERIGPMEHNEWEDEYEDDDLYESKSITADEMKAEKIYKNVASRMPKKGLKKNSKLQSSVKEVHEAYTDNPRELMRTKRLDGAQLELEDHEYARVDGRKLEAENKKTLNERDFNNVQKRIARVGEFDNGKVMHNDWKVMSIDDSEELAKQKSLENPDDTFYVQYDDIMNPSSDVKWRDGQRINEATDDPKSWPNDKVLTYEDAIALAKAYYSQGGDGFYETADKSYFDYLTTEYGPQTVKQMKRSFGVFDSVAKDRMSEAIKYPNGRPVTDIDLNKALDYNYGTDRDKNNSTYSDEEKQRAVNYWIEKTDGMLESLGDDPTDRIKYSKPVAPELLTPQMRLTSRKIYKYLRPRIHKTYATTRFYDNKSIDGHWGQYFDVMTLLSDEDIQVILDWAKDIGINIEFVKSTQSDNPKQRSNTTFKLLPDYSRNPGSLEEAVAPGYSPK